MRAGQNMVTLLVLFSTWASGAHVPMVVKNLDVLKLMRVLLKHCGPWQKVVQYCDGPIGLFRAWGYQRPPQSSLLHAMPLLQFAIVCVPTRCVYLLTHRQYGPAHKQRRLLFTSWL